MAEKDALLIELGQSDREWKVSQRNGHPVAADNLTEEFRAAAHRPLLGFLIALACTGASCLSMGQFFSSLTRNQIAAAILNRWIDNPLLAGKILSSLCGAISCVLVFAITEKLTRSVLLASAVFALVVLNPLHILYSAACMTDVPHACLVLASLFFLLRDRWLVAAVLAAIADENPSIVGSDPHAEVG